MTDSDPDEMLARLGERLADDVEAAIPQWVETCVERIHTAWRGSTPVDVIEQAALAGTDATADVMPALRRLLASDVDDQWTNPLQLLRGAVRHPTAVLRAAQVPEVVRDEFAERVAPDDVYDLEPAGFADLGPDLQEVGLAWGACKARAHLRRHGGGSR